MTKYESLPDRYSDIISEEQYVIVLEIAQDYLAQFGEVMKVSDGLIEFENNEGVTIRFALDNLVRRLSGQDHSLWKGDIEDHFARLLSKVEDSFDLNNFESIREILGIRVYADSYFNGMNLSDQLISRMDFEETRSYLVLDYPDKFQLVYKENFDKWEISEQEAFELAINNAGKYEVKIGKRDFDTFSHFSFFSSTHSVSFIIDFERNAFMCLGKAGSIVNIPTQGSAFAILINNSDVTEMIETIGETIAKIFDEDPGNINTNYYWYYNKTFTMIKSNLSGDGFKTLDFPHELLQIIKTI